MNLVAAAAQLGAATSLLVIFRGADRTRDGYLPATLVTPARFLDTPSFRVGTSDHQELISNPKLLYNVDPMGDFALDEVTGINVWRHRLFRKLQLPGLTDLDTTIFSALAMCVTGFVISGFDLGTAGRVPLSPGEGHFPPAAGIHRMGVPPQHPGDHPCEGGLPNFSLLGHTMLRDILGAWDVVARRVADPSATPILGAISGAFTPWVKDLVRWASTRHPEELAHAPYVGIRDSAAFREHDIAFLGNDVA